MRRAPAPRAALLLLVPAALLLPSLPFPGAEAQGAAAPVQLAYVVNAEDPALSAQGKVQLTWRASGFQGRISAFCLQTDRHDYGIEGFGPLKPGGLWEDHPQDSDTAGGRPACADGHRALVGGMDEVSATFTLDVRRPAFTACGCEFNSFLGPEWGVVKGEALAVPFSYAFFAPAPTFHAVVRVVLPPGWGTEGPWASAGTNAFELPGTGAPLPRGFFVLGRFTPELRDERDAIGKEFVYVRLAGELRSKDSLFEYLKKATPYYQGVYGDVVGDRVLVVSAGPPMFTGGLGSSDSLFVHQNSSADTIAHEYAHVWQRFQTIDVAGHSSIWLNEGDADLHGALSRVVTETQTGFTFAKMNDEFRETYDDHVDDPGFQQAMTVAAYGGPFEQVAYKKGLFTLTFLGQEVRRVTNDTAGLNDVLRELNTYYDTVVAERTGDRRMTNQDVLDVVNRVVQRSASVDMKPFFDRFVLSSEWPPFVEVPPEAPITFDDLEVTPSRIEPGGFVTVQAQATNLRDTPVTRPVELFIDDNLTQTRTITVGPLATVPVTFSVRVDAPGDHVARVAYLRQDFHVLTPAELVVERVAAVTPAQAGAAFDLGVDLRNTGETAARATVQATLAAEERTAEVQVPALGTARARLPFLVGNESILPVDVLVTWGDRTASGQDTVTIGPRDRDGDGTPDASDAFPDDPRLSEAGAINDLRSKVPALEVAAVLVGLGAAALAARRR